MGVNPERVEEEELSTSTQEIAMEQFHGKAHFWGRLTLWSAIILTLSLPVILSFVLGYHPGWSAILAGFIAYASIVAAVWFLEPIMYFPVLGVSGTYISFLTGNIGNMCLPSAAAAQHAIGAEPGTRKGEITATLGIGAASIVNKLFLIPIILGGSVLISTIPENIQRIFPLVLPAIFGGVLAQFAMKKPIYGVIALVVGLLVNMTSLVVYLKMLLCIMITIMICVWIEKRNVAKK